MDIIADYIENYDAKDPQVIKKLKEYQNLSADEWENLSDEQYKEFTALTALYVLSARWLSREIRLYLIMIHILIYVSR